jgi:uncharacterized protein (TIGR02271 family)
MPVGCGSGTHPQLDAKKENAMHTNFEMRDEMLGRPVFGSDGKKLGKLSSYEGDAFIVEKGLLFPKDYSLYCRHIARADEKGIYLDRPADYYVELYESGGKAEESHAGSQMSETQSTAGEIRIPVAEEKLEVGKSMRETGAVRLKKDIVTEQKSVTVPVTREEVHVERVPASDRAVEPGEAAFQQQTISVPVHEEELEIHKRPVVKEEVRVSKRDYQTEQRADATVRRENVEVEPEGNVDRMEKLDKEDEGKKLI